MAFEEEFGCEIPDEEAEKIATVQDAVNYIEANSQFRNKYIDKYEGHIEYSPRILILREIK